VLLREDIFTMASSVSLFITELIRDANQIHKLNDFEKRRMLERAVTTIRDMRETIGLVPSTTVRDAVIDIQTTAALIERGHTKDEHVKKAMLEAAGMLRTLKILLERPGEMIK
jgi:hypothetical protein